MKAPLVDVLLIFDVGSSLLDLDSAKVGLFRECFISNLLEGFACKFVH